ncbi:MAG: LacI family DNA-binding transcriptional regulator, partial [Oscillospiraceae bacterium]|nr:LacI family DNA-binding transcriptional regulator [Oscillospiraceae bacterium]
MTMKELAKLAGVSPSAVSRYLNGGSLSPEKRAVIREAIEKTGYEPDMAAQAL